MKKTIAFGLSVVCAAGLAGTAGAAGDPLAARDAGETGTDIGQVFEEASFREMPLHVSSGAVRVTHTTPGADARAVQVPVWSTVVTVEDSDWIRLYFSEVVLARSTELTRESYLRITSLEDGYEQYLDAQSLAQWSNSTAYFNGNAVRVEIMASPNASSQVNSVRITGAQVSDRVTRRSICFSTDDRVLSDSPQDARLMPIGCSVWLFGDHGSCFLSAGHCSPSSGQVVQFNVPLSSSSGATRNPPPQDQYAIDNASVQITSSVFIGNDWSFFGTFDNSNTGMSPGQAQGASYQLATALPPVDGRPIRITGYGTTSSPVPASWNQVQKTHVGPLVSISGNTVRYQTDTTGGNSGSAIVDDTNSTAFGIHTNAGCGPGGGSNQGTSLFNAGLQAALGDPHGICLPRDIQASLLFEPTHIQPEGGDVVTLVIDNLQGHTVVGLPTMHVVGTDGTSHVGPMVDNGNGSYDGTFASYYCGSGVDYHFELVDEEGTVVRVPGTGSFSTVALDELTIAFDDDFETDQGWVSYTTGGSGNWVRTVPADHGQGDPSGDADGSSHCFVTSNNNGVDVDNGSVVLLSPVVDLSGMDAPVLRVSAWMTGTGPDSMTIEFTDDAGVSWVTASTIPSTGGEWDRLAFDLENYIDLNNAFRMRVTTTDAGADTTVEGGIDGFRISSEVCDASSCPADFDSNGSLDFFDVSYFVNAYGAMNPGADFTGDGHFDFFDVSAFLNAFGAGCP